MALLQTSIPLDFLVIAFRGALLGGDVVGSRRLWVKGHLVQVVLWTLAIVSFARVGSAASHETIGLIGVDDVELGAFEALDAEFFLW